MSWKYFRMRFILFIFSLLTKASILIFCSSCDIEKQGYEIKEMTEIILTERYCEIRSNYPILSTAMGVEIDSLNGILRRINVLTDFTKYCQKAGESREKLTIIGDYSVLLQSDSLLCLEYVVSIPMAKKNIFRCVFVDMNKKQLVEPAQVIPIENTTQLVPFVKHFSDSTGTYVNLSVYEKNNLYALQYGITSNSLVLYLGGEGEGFGYHRIVVPVKGIVIGRSKK